jgi:hypothetical protein
MAEVPFQKWQDWFAARNLEIRVLPLLVRAFLADADERQLEHITAPILRSWHTRQQFGTIMACPNVDAVRKVAGRLLSLAMNRLEGDEANAVRHAIRRHWQMLDSVQSASMRGLTAHALGITNEQFEKLRRSESLSVFREFMAIARTNLDWAGHRGGFWESEITRIIAMGYTVEMSENRDRLIFSLPNGNFVVEFLDSGPLSFYERSGRDNAVQKYALGQMRSPAFRRDYGSWDKLNHVGYWHHRALTGLTEFASRGAP